MKIDGAYARLRAERMELEEAVPPRPLLAWRDVDHVGMMGEGLCIRCFGVADDPRHWGSSLADARHTAGMPLAATVFRGIVLPA
jgi:hypothetical protein